MKIHPKFQPILYGFGVFVVFLSLSVVIKIITHRTASDAEYFGVIAKKDLFLGLIVAVVLTFTHEKKKNLRK